MAESIVPFEDLNLRRSEWADLQYCRGWRHSRYFIASRAERDLLVAALLKPGTEMAAQQKDETRTYATGSCAPLAETVGEWQAAKGNVNQGFHVNFLELVPDAGLATGGTAYVELSRTPGAGESTPIRKVWQSVGVALADSDGGIPAPGETFAGASPTTAIEAILVKPADIKKTQFGRVFFFGQFVQYVPGAGLYSGTSPSKYVEVQRTQIDGESPFVSEYDSLGVCLATNDAGLPGRGKTTANGTPAHAGVAMRQQAKIDDSAEAGRVLMTCRFSELVGFTSGLWKTVYVDERDRKAQVRTYAGLAYNDANFPTEGLRDGAYYCGLVKAPYFQWGRWMCETEWAARKKEADA